MSLQSDMSIAGCPISVLFWPYLCVITASFHCFTGVPILVSSGRMQSKYGRLVN